VNVFAPQLSQDTLPKNRSSRALQTIIESLISRKGPSLVRIPLIVITQIGRL
jgi:hypothetical protein